MKATRLPTFYISHGGGPCFWMDWNPPDLWEQMAKSLRELPTLVGSKPKAILVISAHWEEKEFTIQTHPRPPMLYDYYGFPEPTYKLKYEAPGSPALAERVRELLGNKQIMIKTDSQRGFDHGLFVPFLLIYPKADIPILQLSLQKNLDPKIHFELGQALSPLREEGVLIVGSGFSYHNLEHFKDTTGISEKFDAWLTESLCVDSSAQRKEKLIHWEQAPGARECHPREEHLLPLMVAAGAAGEDICTKFYSERMKTFNFRTSSFKFG